MRKLIVALLVVLTTAGTAAAAPREPGWQLTDTGSTARLRGLSAVSSSTAWASGSAATVLRTTDGGRQWRNVAPDAPSDADFRDITAFDADHAVVLSIGPGEASRLYRTDDGGEHWRETFRNTDDRAFYDCVTFFDPLRGMVMGDPVDGHLQLLSTVDGGRHWRHHIGPKAEPNEAGFAASGQCLTSSFPASAWIGTGGGEHARVFSTHTGGLFWHAATTPLQSSPSAGVFATGFRDPLHGLAIGGDYANPTDATPALAYTRDGGRTWRPTAEAPHGYRSGLQWRDSHTVLAVGPTGSDLSVDGGQRWRQFDDGSFDTVDCAWGACWAAGEQGRIARLE